MPVGAYGQMITFATEISADEKFGQYIYVRARKHDTCRKIAARLGHPEEARTIANLNHIRSTTQVIKTHRRLRIPGTLRQGDQLSILPQDMMRPTITDGYAVYSTVNRQGQIGINKFDGYNPLTMVVPVQFLATRDHDGADVEGQIQILERMAGRGNFKGAASGPPAVIRISCTDAQGRTVPLIPANYQWSPQNPSAPLWRIGGGTSGTTGGIAWDPSPRADDHGHRIDAKAVITVSQYTPIQEAERSSTRRSKKRNTKKKT